MGDEECGRVVDGYTTSDALPVPTPSTLHHAFILTFPPPIVMIFD